MNIVDAALSYAADGWPVLALYRPLDGVCTCTTGADCKSPGKHPREDLCPHGAKDATTDPRVIVGWPDDINIGVALGAAAGGAMAFDVDITEVARALLHPNLGLSDHTGVVATGRPGAHVWFWCKGPTTSFNLRTSGNIRLGEVRGDGLYVVVPPSLAATGRNYRWQGRRLGDPPPRLAVTNDALAYVTDLLAGVGVILAPQAATTPREREVAPGEVNTLPDLPDGIKGDRRLSNIRRALRGNVADPTTDRSGTLYAVAVSVAEVALDRKYPLTTAELAALVKTYDTTAFVNPKYAGRSDADSYYYDLAVKALGRNNGAAPTPEAVPPDDTGIPGQPPPGPEQPESPPVDVLGLDPDYTWNEDDGWLYYRGGRTNRKVANFNPSILEEVEVYRGQGSTTKREWNLQFTLKGGRAVSFIMAAEDTTSMRLEQAISKHCGVDYIVAPAMYGHLKTAIAELARAGGGTAANRVYGTTGWVEHADRWLYLLPSTPGAVAADNSLEPTVRIERDRLGDDLASLFDGISHYGEGVRPPLNAEEYQTAWEAFEALLASGPIHKTLPVVMQVMAGPLASAGLDEALPLVHVLGKTGTLKTSFCLAALGVWGRFGSVPPASWSSTPAYLQLMIHHCKDLTLLVDDFKQRWEKRGLYDLLQNYADKTARGRSGPRQQAQTLQQPRGLILSNGEDLWEDEAATVARTVVIDLMRGDIDPAKLEVAQGEVKAGHLQLFGGAYLSWLAGQQQILDGGYIPAEQDRWGRVLRRGAGEGVHLRLLATIASLLACGSVLIRFVRAVYGEERAVWLQMAVRATLPHLLIKMEEQADQVAALAPWQQLVSAIVDGMVAREASLCPTGGLGSGRRIPDAPRADIVGHYFAERGTGDTMVFVTEGVTFAWLKRWMRRQGEEVRFSWAAVLQDAKSRGYHYKEGQRLVLDGRPCQKNGVLVPLAALMNAATVPLDEGDV